MKGFVYFIASPETGRVKIGFTSKSPDQRLRSLQTGSPTELRLMCFQPGTKADEAHLHDILSPFRLHGEWFEAGDLVVYVMAIVCRNAIKAFEAEGLEPPQWAVIGAEATNECVEEVLAFAEAIH
jgi:hypothetical protein